MKRSLKKWLVLALCGGMLGIFLLTACGKEEPPVVPDETESRETETETVAESEEITKAEVDTDALALVDFTLSGSEGNYTITGVKDRTKTAYTIPDSVVAIGAEAFADCTALTSLTIPDSVTDVDPTAFRGCTSLIQVENGLSYVDRWVIDCDPTVTTVLWKDGTVGIVSSAFEGCAALKSVAIPDSVKYFGFYIFDGCTAIESASIPSDLIISLPKNNLKSVVITKGESIDQHAFWNCSTLQSVTLPEGLRTIGDYAFALCKNLPSLKIPATVTVIGDYAFENCASLTELTLPIGMTEISPFTFTGCSALTGLTIPQSVARIGISAFDGCDSLLQRENGVTYADTWVVLSNSKAESVTVREGTVGIADSAFSGRKNMTEVILPASLKYIGNYAFYECKHLATVELPKDLKTIGYQAFYQCVSLAKMSIPVGVDGVSMESFADTALIQRDNGVYYVDKWVASCDLRIKNMYIRENTIGIAANTFGGCTDQNVYYRGTAEQWALVRVEASGNAYPESDHFYVYSETEPTVAGNYWHSVDGVPTPW